jgi:hypothetical protein
MWMFAEARPARASIESFIVNVSCPVLSYLLLSMRRTCRVDASADSNEIYGEVSP